MVRTCIEVVVVVTGWLLGGTLGLATLLFVVSIGSLVRWFLPLLHAQPPRGSTARRSSTTHSAWWTRVQLAGAREGVRCSTATVLHSAR